MAKLQIGCLINLRYNVYKSYFIVDIMKEIFIKDTVHTVLREKQHILAQQNNANLK